jgi:hypothetical protein
VHAHQPAFFLDTDHAIDFGFGGDMPDLVIAEATIRALKSQNPHDRAP